MSRNATPGLPNIKALRFEVFSMTDIYRPGPWKQ